MGGGGERDRDDGRGEFLAARGLYTAAAAAWRAGRLDYDGVLDAFARLARSTSRCLADAATNEDARRFYREYVVGWSDREVEDAVEAARVEGTNVRREGRAYVAEGLGEWLVARDRLRDVERRLDEELGQRGTTRFDPKLSGHDVKEAIVANDAFEREVVDRGERTWTISTYARYRGWTDEARSLGHLFGYGSARDREQLARRHVEQALGERGEEVFARLVSGGNAERLPAAAVALWVSASRGESDPKAGIAASRALDEHVAAIVERVEGEHDAMRNTTALRLLERSTLSGACQELGRLEHGVSRGAMFVDPDEKRMQTIQKSNRRRTQDLKLVR